MTTVHKRDEARGVAVVLVPAAWLDDEDFLTLSMADRGFLLSALLARARGDAPTGDYALRRATGAYFWETDDGEGYDQKLRRVARFMEGR